jgi:hypothetical protein
MNDRCSPDSAVALIARADKYLNTGSGEYASEIMRDMAEFIRRLPTEAATAPKPEDFAILREIETELLIENLSESIANLGYPVGCGISPTYDHLKRAADTLFERYAKMIEMAHGVAQPLWQPIETVPENHFTVLVYGKYGRLTAFRDIAWQWWPFPAGEPLDYTPTHWMPLPEAPSITSTPRESPVGWGGHLPGKIEP